MKYSVAQLNHLLEKHGAPANVAKALGIKRQSFYAYLKKNDLDLNKRVSYWVQKKLD